MRAGLLRKELHISVYIKCVCVCVCEEGTQGWACQAASSARLLRATCMHKALVDMKRQRYCVMLEQKHPFSAICALFCIPTLQNNVYLQHPAQRNPEIGWIAAQAAGICSGSQFVYQMSVEKRALLEEWSYWHVFSWGMQTPSSMSYCCLWPISSAYKMLIPVMTFIKVLSLFPNNVQSILTNPQKNIHSFIH